MRKETTSLAEKNETADQRDHICGCQSRKAALQAAFTPRKSSPSLAWIEHHRAISKWCVASGISRYLMDTGRSRTAARNSGHRFYLLLSQRSIRNLSTRP